MTVGERLRSNRQQVADAPGFRAQIWAAVRQADDEARRRGYTTDDIELATFATIAFLDESILNLRLPVFADWPRQPLQEERYGHHIAGEIFFQNLQKLLGRQDSHETADLLEVYQLCLLLGFAGRLQHGRPRRSARHHHADRRQNSAHPPAGRGIVDRLAPSPRPAIQIRHRSVGDALTMYRRRLRRPPGLALRSFYAATKFRG